jgi:hypothetical protein
MPQSTTTTSLVIVCHTGIVSPTSTSHVGDWSTTYASHVEDLQPTTASHDGGTSPVTACHTGILSPTSTSHVGNWLTTSASHVEDLQPTTTSHARGTCLLTASHTAHTSPTSASHTRDSSPTSASHVGYFLLASTSHARRMSPAIASHVGGTHMIEKPRHLGHKPRFHYRNCEGSHLTPLCHVTVGIPEAWVSPKGPSGSEETMVSQHYVPSLVDTIVTSMQSSSDSPFPLELMCPLILLSHISFNLWSCQCNIRPTPLLFLGVMHLLTLLSRILFNQWLSKWSYQCNI